ncbi:peptidyl-prolyl cis-trans isomerase A (rotamase A) [Candidatus Accumulibacter aalborgensis]|uniref:Peptidyl-prolyl cis-trans isomerase n=1 Tax=Candidatus Accumulibacter aalborgensis TaxID=1860102 RepID=A0A1A8XZJ0_9PROT|nr:peptidylprolyl isomerase [Candidatus Accumulibacter aalborgensis]SBT09478.1 peptidyl-prolyl cis-trans isomerase A (rotamase A) [Candidatus Accumulibacter aalborgensis]
MTRATSGLLALFAGTLFSCAVVAAPTVEIQTSTGNIVIELDAEKAPKTVQNFVQYVNEGFYNGTVFHRVIPDFMIQGGGFTADMEQKSAPRKVENEGRNGLKNDRGTIAMARTADPHSASSQFFINHRNNAALNYPSPDGAGYAVFGKVTQGMDVVDRIARVATGNRSMHQNVPLEPVIIQSVRIIPEKKQGKP